MAISFSNPYLPQQAQAITDQVTQNLNQQILPQFAANSAAAGGFGGSREALTRGLAINGANDSITRSLAGLYGSAYDADQSRALQERMQGAALASQADIARMSNQTQRDLGFGNLGLGYYQAGNNYDLGLRGAGTSQYNADTSRMLGLGNLDLNNRQADQSFYSTQRGQDLQQYGLGAQLFGQGMQGLAGQGAGVYGAGQNQFNAGYQPYANYANLLSPFTGLNSQQVTTTPGGSRIGGLLGGALGGVQLGSIWGG